MPGGRLSEKYGTRRVLAASLLVSALLTLATPAAASSNLGAWAAVALRAGIGLAQGPLYPSIFPMVVRWAAAAEQNRFAAVALHGGTVGTVIAYPAMGLLLENLHWKVHRRQHWPSIPKLKQCFQWSFYVMGGICLAFCALWMLLVTDYPEDHPWITDEVVPT